MNTRLSQTQDYPPVQPGRESVPGRLRVDALARAMAVIAKIPIPTVICRPRLYKGCDGLWSLRYELVRTHASIRNHRAVYLGKLDDVAVTNIRERLTTMFPDKQRPFTLDDRRVDVLKRAFKRCWTAARAVSHGGPFSFRGYKLIRRTAEGGL